MLGCLRSQSCWWLGGALSAPSAQAAQACPTPSGANARAVIQKAADSGQLTRAQASEARCNVHLITDIAETRTTVTVTDGRPALKQEGASAWLAAGSPVACRSVAKRTSSFNAVGMILIWHQTNVDWCWDSNFIITGGSSYATYDTPGWCWGYNGDAGYGSSGGSGYGYWSVSRGSNFSCAAGNLGFHRTLWATVNARGGGGAN